MSLDHQKVTRTLHTRTHDLYLTLVLSTFFESHGVANHKWVDYDDHTLLTTFMTVTTCTIYPQQLHLNQCELSRKRGVWATFDLGLWGNDRVLWSTCDGDGSNMRRLEMDQTKVHLYLVADLNFGLRWLGQLPSMAMI